MGLFDKMARKGYLERIKRLKFLYEDNGELDCLAVPLTSVATKIEDCPISYNRMQKKELDRLLKILELDEESENPDYVDYFKWVIEEPLKTIAGGKQLSSKKFTKDQINQNSILHEAKKMSALAQHLSRDSELIKDRCIEAEANADSAAFKLAFSELMGTQYRMNDAMGAAQLYIDQIQDAKIRHDILKHNAASLKIMQLVKGVDGKETLRLIEINKKNDQYLKDKSDELRSKLGKDVSDEELIRQQIQFNKDPNNKKAFERYGENKAQELEKAKN